MRKMLTLLITKGESIIEQHKEILSEGIKKADENDLIIYQIVMKYQILINCLKSMIANYSIFQNMYMYKLNLQNLEESNWIGSRITKKKNISSMQKLRNLKFKKYPFWRLDKKSIQIIDGGWHFSFLHTPEDIAKNNFILTD